LYHCKTCRNNCINDNRMNSREYMDRKERNKIIRQLLVECNIPVGDMEALLNGDIEKAGHFTREIVFRKIIARYPWFYIIQLFTPREIKQMLSDEMLKQLRSPSLRRKYEFIRKRVLDIISD
jgi:hypothetical protein